MGWRSKLTYQEVAATGIVRSLPVLAYYGDLDSATAVLTENPLLADDPEAFAVAAENGHEMIVRLMLRHQPRLAERVAIMARTWELTEFLFQNGMNSNLPGWLGVTPLHRFAERGDVEKAAIFLDHGADLDARDDEFCTTPLGYAARTGKLRMVEFLLRRGAKVKLSDGPAWATPIALATYRGFDEIVRVLNAFETTGTLPVYSVQSMESLANDFVVACESGEAGAIQRIIDHFYIRRPMSWDRPQESVRISGLRRFVHDRLPRKPQKDSDTLELSGAQLLVARSYGFDSWRELLVTLCLHGS